MSENDQRKAWEEPGEHTGPGRRQFPRGLAAAGALAGTGSLLAACSSGSAAPAGTGSLLAACSSGSAAPAVSPAPAAGRSGGNLKVGLTGGSGSDPLDPGQPNGTGPFKYQSFTPGQRSVFVRNPHYRKPGLPYLDAITVIDFSDSTSLQSALTTGVIQGAGAQPLSGFDFENFSFV